MSYFTSIFPDSPGKIGPSGFFGTVHPQVDFTLEIIRGALPVLVNSNTLTPSEPFSIVSSLFFFFDWIFFCFGNK